MKKNELKIIENAIAGADIRKELCFASIDFDNMIILATNTRKLIKYYLRADEVENCSGKHFVHKSMFKAIIEMCGNNTEYKFINNDIVIGDKKIRMSNIDKDAGYKYPMLDEALHSIIYDDSYIIDNLDFIDFDLTHKNTHINSDDFKTLQAHADAGQYQIDSVAQTRGVAGRARIIGVKDDAQRFVAILLGVEYKPQAPSLFDEIYHNDDDNEIEDDDVLSEGLDALYEDAKKIVLADKKTSISYLQRILQIGYNRTARIVEQLEITNVISTPNAKGIREIL